MRTGKFRNPWPHRAHGLMDILRWKLGLPPRERPVLPDAPQQAASLLPLAPQDLAVPPSHGWRVVWLGHASFLLQGSGTSLLIDPVFADYCAPFPIPSLKRKQPPPCRHSDLPHIDAVLLTHSHYDHLDLPTLRNLGLETRLLVAEGHAAWLRKKGFNHVDDVRWHESVSFSPQLRITATPAQHFTARSPFDRDRAHWCGWLLEGACCKLWHAGDSGYCRAFREIGDRHGPIDFGMIPIGAYQPRHIMRPMHMNPEEAAQAFLHARCRRAVGMHWGTFRLTDEPLGEPPLRLAAALRERDIPASSFTTGAIGQAWEIHPDVSSQPPHH